MINAYNCIDGINGLAGGLAMINALVFGLMFWYIGSINMAIMAFALAGALFGFLHFNFGKAKIFMGDNGSTVVGFVLAIFAIQYMNIQPNLAETTALPAIVFSIIFIPMVDFLKVIFTRMLRGKSPFYPDRTHIHHQFLSLGLSHKSVCYILYSINIMMIITIMFFGSQNGWGNILPISFFIN